MRILATTVCCACLVGLLCLCGCGCRFPGGGTAPEKIGGHSTALGNGTMYFIHWKNGPAIVICTDIKGGAGNWQSGGSSPPPLSREKASQRLPDGRAFEWQMETTDGQNIRTLLDGREYDLTKGNVFLVKTAGGKTEVEQFPRELSGVEPNPKSCEAYARKDEKLRKFLGLDGD